MPRFQKSPGEPYPVEHHEETDSVRVLVAIPTFRRNATLRPLVEEVLRQIDSLEAQRWDARVAVIDNDPAGGARDAAKPLLLDPRVRYFMEPKPGISAARNRAIDEARDSSLLVMIDDDVVPMEGWLEAILTAWRVSRSAVVMGENVLTYEGDVDPWVTAGRRFSNPSPSTGTDLREAYTYNILLDLDQIRPTGIRFDPEFGLTGGSDSLFTSLLRRRGLRLTFCRDSVVTELQPAHRASRRWILRRRWRTGNARSRVDLTIAEGRFEEICVRLKRVAIGLLGVGGGALMWAMGTVGGNLRRNSDGLQIAAAGAGMIAGALGIAYSEYARPKPAGVKRRRPRQRFPRRAS